MATAGTAYIELRAKLDQFERDLRGAETTALKSGQTFGTKFSTGVDSKMSKLKSFGKTAAKGMAVGAASVLGIVAVGATKAFEAGQEAAEIAAQTEAVIKSTGGAANLTEKQVASLAGTISGYSAIEDDTVQSGLNMLLTFTNIRNEVGEGNDIFNQASASLADMSVAMGTDMKGAAIQVGKALNDPIKGVTALGRAGVQFTEKQKKTIERLVETNRTMDAQKVILGELETQFGGTARKVGNTKGWDKMKNAIGEVMESIGVALLPVINDLAERLRKFVESDKFQRWVETAEQWLKEKLPEAIRKTKQFFENDLKPAFQNASDAIRPFVGALDKVVSALGWIVERGGGVGNILKNMIPGGQLLGGLLDDGGPTVPGVFGGSALAMGTSLMGVYPGLVRTSAYRPGDPGFHGDASNPAGDYAMAGWPSDTSGVYTPQAAMIAQTAISMFGSNIRELIYGNMIYQNGQMGYYGANDHWGHIHLAARGFHGMVNKPTRFIAGEAGPERVDISPRGQSGGGMTVNIYGPIYGYEDFARKVNGVLKQNQHHGARLARTAANR